MTLLLVTPIVVPLAGFGQNTFTCSPRIWFSNAPMEGLSVRSRPKLRSVRVTGSRES